ncbi:helix-turn-helix domain-containing protein [Hyphococcus lacteus]|uniref:Short-chain fatty acyl-CoA regulator family protein n=1 Tax=Hyphococcus lacteus TaxID=3143536 RepID=A0ABV3Z1F2_9PROT
MARETKPLYVGPRIRRIRRDLGLTQAQMAADLEVSASYVTLIERNQRPLPADLLLRIAETYGLDLSAFASGEDDVFNQLEGMLVDPIFHELSITKEDVRDLMSANPAMGEAVAALYGAYRASRTSAMEARAAGKAGGVDSVEEARDFITVTRNYFPVLDEMGEEIAAALSNDGGNFFDALSKRFKTRHGLSVRVLPADIMVGAYRRHDRHRKQVMVSEALDLASRSFQLTLQLALIEGRAQLDAVVNQGAFESDAGRRLTRAALANYLAGAIMLPYRKFHQSAEELSYDVESIARRFGASFEQVCHRLTTLQRPGAEGVPFFFLRIDAAGNVSKRFSGGVFPFARYGGSCPLWNLHDTFRTPRKIHTQTIQLPDGETYFSIARTVHGGEGGFNAPKAERAVTLGCELKYADKLIYAKNTDLGDGARAQIGVTCRLCSRPACAARAHPPLERRLIIDEHRRLATPFSFAFD